MGCHCLRMVTFAIYQLFIIQFIVCQAKIWLNSEAHDILGEDNVTADFIIYEFDFIVNQTETQTKFNINCSEIEQTVSHFHVDESLAKQMVADCRALNIACQLTDDNLYNCSLHISTTQRHVNWTMIDVFGSSLPKRINDTEHLFTSQDMKPPNVETHIDLSPNYEIQMYPHKLGGDIFTLFAFLKCDQINQTLPQHSNLRGFIGLSKSTTVKPTTHSTAYPTGYPTAHSTVRPRLSQSSTKIWPTSEAYDTLGFDDKAIAEFTMYEFDFIVNQTKTELKFYMNCTQINQTVSHFPVDANLAKQMVADCEALDITCQLKNDSSYNCSLYISITQRHTTWTGYDVFDSSKPKSGNIAATFTINHHLVLSHSKLASEELQIGLSPNYVVELYPHQGVEDTLHTFFKFVQINQTHPNHSNLRGFIGCKCKTSILVNPTGLPATAPTITNATYDPTQTPTLNPTSNASMNSLTVIPNTNASSMILTNMPTTSPTTSQTDRIDWKIIWTLIGTIAVALFAVLTSILFIVKNQKINNYIFSNVCCDICEPFPHRHSSTTHIHNSHLQTSLKNGKNKSKSRKFKRNSGDINGKTPKSDQTMQQGSEIECTELDEKPGEFAHCDTSASFSFTATQSTMVACNSPGYQYHHSLGLHTSSSSMFNVMAANATNISDYEQSSSFLGATFTPERKNKNTKNTNNNKNTNSLTTKGHEIVRMLSSDSSSVFSTPTRRIKNSKINSNSIGIDTDIDSSVDSINSTPLIKSWTRGELLGSGGFGHVWLAIEHEQLSMFAVKQVRMNDTDWHGNADAAKKVKELENEIKFLSKLQHPNIVQYWGCCRTSKMLNIYLEFVPAGSIENLIRVQGAIGLPLLRDFATEILNGLTFLHSKNIIHHDIKGANILIDHQGSCKIADFGGARSLGLDSSVIYNTSSIHGTINWMAPEVISQSGHDKRADIWSFGCTLLEMATGKLPWSTNDDEGPKSGYPLMLYVAVQDKIPAIPKWIEMYDNQLYSIVKMCLQRDSEKRPTAQQLQSEKYFSANDIEIVTSSTSRTNNNTIGNRDEYDYGKPTRVWTRNKLNNYLIGVRRHYVTVRRKMMKRISKVVE